MKKNIKSLNGLRFVLALFVFLCHSAYFGLNEKTAFLSTFIGSLGGIAVTAFFVLSGFCIYLGYSDKFAQLTKESYFRFEKKRIKKIYPLYILTTVIMLLGQFISQTLGDYVLIHVVHRAARSGIKLVLCSLMIQTLVPGYSLSGNGAGWFISSIFVIYLLTPFILLLLSKIKISRVKALIGIVFCFAFVFVFDELKTFLVEKTGKDIFIELFYTSPFTRIFEYLSGIFVAVIFKSFSDSDNFAQSPDSKRLFSGKIIFITFLEFLFLALSIAVYHTKLSFINAEAFSCLLYVALIFLISFEKGGLSLLFKTKAFQFLGSLSMEIYLIHYTLQISKIQYNFEKSLVASHQSASFLIILGFLILNFILTVVLSWLWKKYSQKIPFVSSFEKALDS